MLNQKNLIPTRDADQQQKKNGFRTAMLYSFIAILGCAVVALSVVLGITINNKESIAPQNVKTLSVNSPYNVKFAMHEPDVAKDVKAKQENDVMRCVNCVLYEHNLTFLDKEVRRMLLQVQRVLVPLFPQPLVQTFVTAMCVCPYLCSRYNYTHSTADGDITGRYALDQSNNFC